MLESNSSKCVMRGSCGSKGWSPKPLPCPYDGPPEEPEDEATRELLVSICGAQYAEGPVCCRSNQLETLLSNLNQAENLISSCPACRNNFRAFYCTFTCDPDQARFLNVTSTQKSSTGQTAVKSLDFYVGERFGTGFFDSCKDVQIGATNGYAMDLIGGGAKNYTQFLQFMGDEKDLGSPFQINYHTTAPPEFTPLNPSHRNCYDDNMESHCTCIDCPNVCKVLPYVPPPNSGPTCTVGALSCLSFFLVLIYAIMVAGFALGYAIVAIRNRREKTYERMPLSVDTGSPRSQPRGLVGAGSLAEYIDGEQSPHGQSESRRLGRGVSLLDPLETVQPRQYMLNTILRRAFFRLGLFAASSPWLMFFVVFTTVGLLNIGWKAFKVETDPVRLWVAPTSESRLQKEFYDANFGPFYRIEQIFVTSLPVSLTEPNQTMSDNPSTLSESPVLSWEHLKYWFDVEAHIRSIRSPRGYGLQDVCFKPAGPGGACVVRSPAAWFGNDLGDYDEDTWAEQLLKCAYSPVDCLPDFQQPIAPNFVLGGVPLSEDGTNHYLEAEALVVTYVVSDSLVQEEQAKAMDWEESLREYLTNLSEKIPREAGLRITFSTGVSLEEEINKSTNTDIKIVVLSYLAMFLYISLTLGHGAVQPGEEGVSSSLKSWAVNLPRFFRFSRSADSVSDESETPIPIFPLSRGHFVGSKFTLGLFGIVIVILSVSSSVGLFSALGVKVTLIIAEVIPFLVLAVGVDNIFILVHELDRKNILHGPNALIVSHLGGANSSASPAQSHRSPFDSSHDESVDAASMPLYLSVEDRVARTLSKMGPSILMSSVTQTAAFALGALVPMPAVRNFAIYAAGSVLLNAILQMTVFVSALALDLKRTEANRVDCFPCIRAPTRIALPDTQLPWNAIGRVGRFIRRRYAPLILRPVVKGVVLLVFAGVFVLSVISIQHMRLGLDQRLALPSESYLIPYFDDLDAYLDIGPPLYFVVHNTDVTKRLSQQALCGRFTTCNDFSVSNVLEAERKRTNSSFISEPSASWIDDFFQWLDPGKEDCCRVRRADPSVFCSDRDSPRLCQPCFLGREPAWNITMAGFPEDAEFMKYLKRWLVSPTTEECPLAGKASFGSALSISPGDSGVFASHFRTFHSPLKSQEDFINAFSAAHRIANDISQRIGASVFPYSSFYVFFDQYAHIIVMTQEILGLGLAAVLVLTTLMLGSWRTGSIVTGVVALTVVSVMGVMPLWGVRLNAISLVNLVISLGISVEFCIHIAKAFMSAGSGLPLDHPAGQKERDERMWTALIDVGPSVLSGITFTKLIGMSVLALTHSKLLEVYYFRMWLTLIISGMLHGLVLLPVILSFAGGAGFPQQEADEDWMSNAIRIDYDHAPFLADDDDDDSASY